jgi:hypothetical protein
MPINKTTYRAFITDPNRPELKPDRYGTLTIPGALTDRAFSIEPLRKWARETLKHCSPGAVCEIYKTEETLVERIDRVKPMEPECSGKS